MNTSFERCELTKVEWLTPPDLVRKLGEFDLDPCSPVNAPFLHAKSNFTIEDKTVETTIIVKDRPNADILRNINKLMKNIDLKIKQLMIENEYSQRASKYV